MTEVFDLRDINIIKAILIIIIILVYVACLYVYHVIISKLSIIDLLNSREIWVFNTREIASFICIAVLLYIVISHSKPTQNSTKNLLKAFFVKDIVIVCMLAILHLLFAIVILNFIGFWKVSLLKDTIIWFMFSASVAIFNIQKADKDKKYFKDIIIDNIKISAIIEFLTGQYTFNFFVEILLTIVSIFIVGLLAVAKEEKHKDVKKLLNAIVIIIGGVMLYHSLSEIIQNITNINTAEKVGEFSLPIIFTLWFTPFFYILYLYMSYESRFLAMKSAIEDKNILSYAKRQAVISFKDDNESLKRWTNTLFLDQPKTKEDVEKSIRNIKELKLIEQNPPTVNSTEGWSPYKAKDFLKAAGVETGFYNRCYEDEWQASSSYIELNDSWTSNSPIYCIADNVAYYVSGNSTVSKQLKLILNINSMNDESSSISKFHEYAKSLYKAAFDEGMPNIFTSSIFKKRNKTLKIFNKNVSVQKRDYLDRNKGYSMIFSIVAD